MKTSNIYFKRGKCKGCIKAVLKLKKLLIK